MNSPIGVRYTSVAAGGGSSVRDAGTKGIGGGVDSVTLSIDLAPWLPALDRSTSPLPGCGRVLEDGALVVRETESFQCGDPPTDAFTFLCVGHRMRTRVRLDGRHFRYNVGTGVDDLVDRLEVVMLGELDAVGREDQRVPAVAV